MRTSSSQDIDLAGLIVKHRLRVKPVLDSDNEIEFWAVGHVTLSPSGWMSYVQLDNLAQEKELKHAVLKAISLYGGDGDA